MRAIVSVTLGLILAGCLAFGAREPPMPAPISGESNVTSSSAATTALPLQLVVEQYGWDKTHPSCPGISPRDGSHQPRDGDLWEFYVMVHVESESNETVLSHRLAWRGLMTDGGEMKPCARTFSDIYSEEQAKAISGNNATQFTLWFAIPYHGEGTTPMVDRVALDIDATAFAVGDLRHSVYGQQDSFD